MKSTITLQGRDFDSRRALCERFGVSVTTIQRWKDQGLLPPPLRRFGKTEFYDRLALEARLAGASPAASALAGPVEPAEAVPLALASEKSASRSDTSIGGADSPARLAQAAPCGLRPPDATQ